MKDGINYSRDRVTQVFFVDKVFFDVAQIVVVVAVNPCTNPLESSVRTQSVETQEQSSLSRLLVEGFA